MGRRFESCRAHHYSMKQTIIINTATGITKKCDILKKNKSKLSELAKRLLEKEVIFKEDLVKILGERPFVKDEN